MYVLWRLILIMLLTWLGLCFTVRNEADSNRTYSEEIDPGQHSTVALEAEKQLPVQSPKRSAAVKVKRDIANDDSSSSFWSWLTGRENPDPCMMASVGGVVGGGTLTGAFVGAGIGSIFTGPGTLIGAFIGGVAGLFGGVSFGHRAGAVVCPCVAIDYGDQCFPNK